MNNEFFKINVCSWSEHDGLYTDGSIVRHQGQLYKAVANIGTLGVAAEPGDSDHSRFYVSLLYYLKKKKKEKIDLK